MFPLCLEIEISGTGGYRRPCAYFDCAFAVVVDFIAANRNGFQFGIYLEWSFSGERIAEQMLTEQCIGLRACCIASNSFLMRSETGECTGGYKVQMSERKQEAENIKANVCEKKRK